MNARRRDSKRKVFPDTLYCRTDGYFWYRNPKPGKPKGLGREKAEAFRQARIANAALASTADLSLADWALGKDEKSLAAWAEEYKKIYIETRKPAPNTVSVLTSCIRAILAADFSKKKLKAVTTKDCSEFIDEAAVTRGPRSAIAIRSCLLDMYREAGVKGEVDNGFNPVAITRKPSAEVTRERLSLEQFLEIRKHLDGWAVNAMNLALLTAQRREDIALARFTDIKDGYWYCEQGKTGMKIRIPLTLRLSAVGLTVGDVVKQCRDMVSKYVIHHTSSGGQYVVGDPVSKDRISKRFSEGREAAGIVSPEGKIPPTFHEIRSLAVRLYEKEYGRAFAQKLAGHKSAKMTDMYADPRGSEWLDVAAG